MFAEKRLHRQQRRVLALHPAGHDAPRDGQRFDQEALRPAHQIVVQQFPEAICISSKQSFDSDTEIPETDGTVAGDIEMGRNLPGRVDLRIIALVYPVPLQKTVQRLP